MASSAVHPRACGEHSSLDRGLAEVFGSSPRVRGTLRTANATSRIVRFIPARAGNTRYRPGRRLWLSVHPRACGEHACAVPAKALLGGSSPRVRGTLHGVLAEGPALRFIPARAGNTPHRPARRVARPVHPRACGEHLTWPHWTKTSGGSSPRVRGTRVAERAAARGRRFIPARAGNTHAIKSPHRHGAVHPRACGEHLTWPHWTKTSGGSSPRVRGTRVAERAAARGRRFIPARAGNTCCRTGRSPRTPVHPRACGEHPRHQEPTPAWSGSSPRVRGTLARLLHPVAKPRFIPARAGNTGATRRRRGCCTVHPRACGEHS